MANHKHTLTMTAKAAICSLAVLVILTVGCKKKTDEPAPTEKPAAAVQDQLKQQVTEFVNARCPIMTENKIEPAKVTDDLIRDHKGQKVAFCCAACPLVWDKLSDTEKDAKLAIVLIK